MKIVLDTNILVSALLSPTGAPSQIVSLVLAGKVSLLCDNRILLEYEEVLRRPKFAFPESVDDPILQFLEAEGEQVLAEPQPEEFGDEGDRAFYEVAVSGDATYLVTGNQRHYPTETWIVNPTEFLQRYRRRKRQQR